MNDESIVYIGSKPPMTYVMAVLTAFNKMGADRVALKARGQAISSAVDVAEICRNRFLSDLERPVIEISTEELESEQGGKRNVSTMTIVLSKTGKPAAAEAKPKAKKAKAEEKKEEA